MLGLEGPRSILWYACLLKLTLNLVPQSFLRGILGWKWKQKSGSSRPQALLPAAEGGGWELPTLLLPLGFSVSCGASRSGFLTGGPGSATGSLTILLQMSRQPSFPLDHLVVQRFLWYWRCERFPQPLVKLLKYGNCALGRLGLLD